MLTSLCFSPSAAIFCGSALTCNVPISGNSVSRTPDSFGSALAIVNNLSRAASNCWSERPPVFCNSIVKPSA